MYKEILLEYSSLAYLRIWQIIGKPKATPAIPALIPISRSKLLQMVRDGTFPQPVRLSPRCVAWKLEDVREWIANREGA